MAPAVATGLGALGQPRHSLALLPRARHKVKRGGDPTDVLLNLLREYTSLADRGSRDDHGEKWPQTRGKWRLAPCPRPDP
jgi:hypothetical protein